MQDAEWRKSHGIEKYQIDRKLKEGKDYPSELVHLFAWLNDRRPMLQVRKVVKGRDIENVEALRQYEAELSLIEQAFMGIIFKRSSKTIKNWIKKINAKLLHVHPVLSMSAGTLSFDHEVNLDSLTNSGSAREDVGQAYLLWALLARGLIDLDPKLVHKCPYCKGIFISRQRKKYHPPCRVKFWSEKAIKEGLARERQKDYRERLKLKNKIR